MRAYEFITENTRYTADQVQGTAQRMIDQYQGLKYSPRERANDHAQSYESNTLEYRYWCAVADEITRLQKAQEQSLSEEDEPVLKLGDTGRAKALEWIKKVYTKYPYVFNRNHVMAWGEGDNQELAMFDLEPSFSKRGAVEVKWFQAYPLRRGIGGRAMRELQSLAREDGIALTLFPWDKGQVSQAKLIKFYRSVGFNPTTKGGKSMYWEPGQSVNENSDDGAEAFKAHLIKTLPQIMKLFANVGKGWSPSKEQMLAAVDTGYQVMKHTGDAKQAGKAVMDELNTLYANRMKNGQQGVAEARKRGKKRQPKFGRSITTGWWGGLGNDSGEGGGEGVSESGDDLPNFRKSLGNAVRGRVSQMHANTAIANAQGVFKWKAGDLVYSPTTGKTYEITGTAVLKNGPVYLYTSDSGDPEWPEKGTFSINRGAHETLKKVSSIKISGELLEGGADEIHNYKKLDRILYKLCDLIKKGQASDRDYGRVAAAVLDPDNNLVARLNRPGSDGRRIHAERAALEAYAKRYGDVPEGSIILTTLSPCNDYMDERDGPSCTDIVNASGIKKVYCGYTDPTHETDTRQFNIMETADPKLRNQCKQIADTFLKQDVAEVRAQLDERATDIVYHYTSIHNAYNILQTGNFLLANSSGTGAEAQHAPAGYPYFLSTSRSKSGDYHRYVGSGGVMFVLDGRWLSDRYPVKPVDYWYSGKTQQNLKAGEWRTIDPLYKRAMWQSSPNRGRESEDRVFSKDNAIPIDCVTAIHMLLKTQDSPRSRLARRILIDAKKRNIPIYLYTSEDDWRTQNIRNSVPPSSVKDLLISTEKERHYARRPVRGLGASEYGRSGLLNWIELIKKQPGQPLNPAADKLRYNLMYYDDTYTVLANDIHNARKPDSNEYNLGVRLSSYMQQYNLTPKALQNSLREKWRTPRSNDSVNENDAQHREQLQKTGFWGRRGAGCLFLARDTGRIGIAHRSQSVEQPGTWGTWGGALDDNESPADAVKREAREEAGYTGDLTLVPLYVFSHESGFRYYNFLALIDSEFTPSLNWETQSYRWVNFGDWPQPLHPGMTSLLSHSASLETIKKYSLQHAQSDHAKKP